MCVSEKSNCNNAGIFVAKQFSHLGTITFRQKILMRLQENYFLLSRPQSIPSIDICKFLLEIITFFFCIPRNISFSKFWHVFNIVSLLFQHQGNEIVLHDTKSHILIWRAEITAKYKFGNNTIVSNSSFLLHHQPSVENGQDSSNFVQMFSQFYYS